VPHAAGLPGLCYARGVRLLGWILAATLGLTSIARAEDVSSFQTEGSADASSSDARTAALDEAFQRAVTLALNEVVDAPTRTANKAALDQHILQRARLWVANFKVSSDTTSDGRREVSVLVRVDKDKLRARLAELAITTTNVVPSGPRSTVVLLRVASPEGPRATYGAGATQELPGVGALSAALRTGGFTVKKAPAVGAAARAEGELPLEDAEAEQLAVEAKADQFAVAGVSVGTPVVLRGVPESGVLVTATVRIVERKSQAVVGQGTARVAARGADAEVVASAVDRAVVGAASDAIPPRAVTPLAQADGYAGPDALVAETGVVLVKLAARTPWGIVVAQQKYLAGAKGVTKVTLRRMSPSGFVLGVETAESPERVAQLAKKGSSKVKVVNGVVELSPGGAM